MSSSLKVSFKGQLVESPVSGFDALNIGAGEKKRPRGPDDGVDSGFDGAADPVHTRFMWRAILSSIDVLNEPLRRKIIEQADADVFSVDRGNVPLLTPFWGAFEEARGKFLLIGVYDSDFLIGRVRALDGIFGSHYRTHVQEILNANMGEFNIDFRARPVPDAASDDELDLPVRIRTYATDEEKAAFRQTAASQGKFRAAAQFLLARLQAQIQAPPDFVNANQQKVDRDFLLHFLERTGDPAALMRKRVATMVRDSNVKSLELLRKGDPLRELYMSPSGHAFAVPVTPPIAFIGVLDRSRTIRELLTIEETAAFWPNSELSRFISDVFRPGYGQRYVELARKTQGTMPALEEILADAIFANEIVHMSHAPLLFGEEPIVFPSNTNPHNQGFPVDLLTQVSLVPDQLFARDEPTLSLRISPEIPFMVHNYQHRVPGANNSSAILALSAVSLDRKPTVKAWLKAARERRKANIEVEENVLADTETLLARRTVIKHTPVHGEYRNFDVTFGRALAAE